MSTNGLNNEKIECNIKYDNADSCLFKYNTLKESLKNHKMKSIPYRISILKKLLVIIIIIINIYFINFKFQNI